MYMTARKGGYSARDSAMGIIETYSGLQAVMKKARQQASGASKPKVANEPASAEPKIQTQAQPRPWKFLGTEEKLERLSGELSALRTLTGLSLAFTAIGSDKVTTDLVAREIRDLEKYDAERIEDGERFPESYEDGRIRVYRALLRAMESVGKDTGH
jgi:hypothetical protein